LTYNRQDFWATTSNKQLNFVQHIRSILKIDGRAAVVVPDNVLFEGGSRRNHPQAIIDKLRCSYAASFADRYFLCAGRESQTLIFFDNKPASKEPWTKELWIYDLRTNIHFTLKTNRMSRVPDRFCQMLQSGKPTQA
jgi:type I restriction enzyme M protein